MAPKCRKEGAEHDSADDNRLLKDIDGEAV